MVPVPVEEVVAAVQVPAAVKAILQKEPAIFQDLRILHYPTENGEEGLGLFESLGWSGGKVDSISVNKSSGYSRLDNAARKAVKDGSCNASVWTEFKVPVKFTLE